MRFLLILFISISAFAQAPEWKEPDFSKITIKDLEKYEKEMLNYFKDLSPSELQNKYLLASRHFSQNGEYQKALWLLRRGLPKAKPETSYLRDYFSLLHQAKERKEFNDQFAEIISKENFQKPDNDELSEITLIYLRLNNMLSQELKEKFLQKALSKSPYKEPILWNDSLTQARRKQHKESLALLKNIKTIGEEDNVYVSWLQKKNKLLPKYCSKVQTFPQLNERSNYKKTCSLILSDEKNLDEKIKETNEIIENSPLHEVLF